VRKGKYARTTALHMSNTSSPESFMEKQCVNLHHPHLAGMKLCQRRGGLSQDQNSSVGKGKITPQV